MSDDAVDYYAFPPRSGGGQQVVSVSTGVLAVHRESGVAVACTEERSQLKNRLLATDRLNNIVNLIKAQVPT